MLRTPRRSSSRHSAPRCAIETMVNDGTGHFTEADTLALSGFIFDTDFGLL